MDAILCEPRSLRTSITGLLHPKMASEATSELLISKNFLGEHAPRPPYSPFIYIHRVYILAHQTLIM